MTSFLFRRSIGLCLVVLGVSFVVFIGMHMAPGDPIRLIVHAGASAEDVANLRKLYGLDDPVLVQFAKWLGRIAHGDLGRSIHGRASVRDLLMARLPNTLILGLASSIIVSIVAFPMGIYAAVKRTTLLAHLLNFLVFVVVSTPTFWLGMILIILFSMQLKWFPTSGYAPLKEGLIPFLEHLVLPAVTLAAYNIAWLTRTIRSSMLEVLSQDFIRTARSKGLSERAVVLHHALRNAWVAIVTIMGIQFGFLLAGTVVVEQVFAWPGIGRLLVTEGIYRRDIPVVQGIALFIAVLFAAISFIVDALYAYLEPRIRYE